jgi:hypothetical protein
MFEILTQEQVKEMTDRELDLSEYYFRHNLNEIANEIYRRKQRQINDLSEENNNVVHYSSGTGNALKEIFVGEDKTHKRGRKKKVGK